ncbi:MAG: hypothetical protein ACOCQM_04665 [Natronomonas sp.]
MPTRRHLLAAAGVATASAGCLGVLGDDGEPNAEGNIADAGDDDDDTQTVELGELSVQNNHEEGHQVQLAVEAEDGMLHLGTYQLEAGGSSTTIEGEWNDEPGAYRIHARLDDGEIRTSSVTDGVGGDAECVRVLVRVDNDGSLAVWNGAGCES